MVSLEDLGWDAFFGNHWQTCTGNGDLPAGVGPARVVEEQKGAWRVHAPCGELWADVTGRLRYLSADRGDLPAVGDWVAVQARPREGRATIHHILPRRSKCSRKIAGRKLAEQVVAANVNTIFVMTSLNRELNLRRLERYLALVWESGATPAVLLTKADLCLNVAELAAEVESAAIGVRVHALSALTGEGLAALAPYLQRGRTVALLGSSGVGKSTLINRLLGRELLPVREVRAGDDRGRHTTTARQLILLPGGGMLVDTPGMRELGLWESDAGLRQTFEDVESLAARCRFTNCRHLGEPGCATQGAIADGRLDAARLKSYRKLERELRFQVRKQDKALASADEKKWRKIHKEQKRLYQRRNRM